MKHLFVSMSVKQNLFVLIFVHKCLMTLNDVEYTTFKMFVRQMSNYLFVISFQLMFYKTLHYRLARPLSNTTGSWRGGGHSQNSYLNMINGQSSMILFEYKHLAIDHRVVLLKVPGGGGVEALPFWVILEMCGKNGWVFQAKNLRMGVNFWP